jgi:HK97 family phage portal protein
MERKDEFRLFGIPIWKRIFNLNDAELRSGTSGVSTLHNPSDWLINALGGAGLTGENISPEMAMTIPTFAGCVKVLAETIAMLPLKPMKRDSDGNTSVDTGHPNYYLLHDRPNPMMNAFIWKETMQTHAGMYGNGYSLIIRNADSRPIELRLIHNPKDVTPFVFDNKLWYKVKGLELPVICDDMFHISGLSYDGISGKPTVQILRNVLGLAIAVEKYGNLIFTNGGAKRVAFESPGKLDPQVKENIKTSWKEKYGGPDKQHEPAFLEAGLKMIEVGMDPMSAQFIELKKHLITEITRIFRVQLHLVQSMEQATNNNIEKQSREFIDYTMMPWMVKWEKEADIKLYSAAERSARFTKFNVKSLLRGDFKTQTDGLVKMIQWGIYSPNDALRVLDENTRKDGDVYIMPVNMATTEQIAEGLNNDIQN